MNFRMITTVVVLATLYVAGATEEHHKRAPSGFTGVRGKKSIPDSEYSTGNSETSSDLKAPASDVGTVNKRAPSGFFGMRGKKPYSVWEGTYPDEVYNKRAPSGFMGMRGKKDMELAGYDVPYDKRAPSGFMGMRGKKFQSDYPEKRAYMGSMGFMGMRGKKDDDQITEDKRAPSGFFGMRGKKMPRQSAFFGMRGKKYPYEFRGKFVGVRGKKMSNAAITEPDYSDLIPEGQQELDLNQLMLLLTDNAAARGVWNGDNNELGGN